jgi:hypothetical protein
MITLISINTDNKRFQDLLSCKKTFNDTLIKKELNKNSYARQNGGLSRKRNVPLKKCLQTSCSCQYNCHVASALGPA